MKKFFNFGSWLSRLTLCMMVCAIFCGSASAELDEFNKATAITLAEEYNKIPKTDTGALYSWHIKILQNHIIPLIVRSYPEHKMQFLATEFFLYLAGLINHEDYSGIVIPKRYTLGYNPVTKKLQMKLFVMPEAITISI